MLENIINNVKGQLTGELQNKFNLQPDKADQSVELAKEHMTDGLRKQATGGDFGGIMDVLKGNRGATAEHAGVNSIIGNYVNDLTTKLGLPESVARQVGPFVITFLMNKVTGKVNAQGMGQSDIMSMLGGGSGGGLKSNLTKGLGDKLGGLF